MFGGANPNSLLGRERFGPPDAPPWTLKGRLGLGFLDRSHFFPLVIVLEENSASGSDRVLCP